MDINIQLVSGFNQETKQAGLVYELNLIKDGKVLRSKTLKYEKESFHIDGKDAAYNALNQRIKEVIQETRDNFDCNSITVSLKHNAFGVRKQELIENNVNLKTFKNPETIKKVFRNKDFLLRDLIFSKNNLDLKKSNEENKNVEDINSFLQALSAKKKVVNEIYQRRILKNSDIDKFFIDYVDIQEFERKRYGYSIELYSSKEGMKNGFDRVFKDSSISLGDNNEMFNKIHEKIVQVIKDLHVNGKSVSLNMPKDNTWRHQNLMEKLEQSKLLPHIELTHEGTKTYQNNREFLEGLIKKNIELHLEKLKDPNTVAIFTDGSANVFQKKSGAGVLIRHNGKEERHSFTREHKIPKNMHIKNPKFREMLAEYGEFRAVKEALGLVIKNPEYQGKQIIIVSDKGDISAALKRKKNKEEYEQFPFLDDIDNMIKHFDLDDKILFHNVKSHLHDNITIDQKDEYFDFYYNNEVDNLAREGAGFKAKEQSNEPEVYKSKTQLQKERKRNRQKQ
jgi:ribonuclease HI